jgi:hypothetical protein
VGLNHDSKDWRITFFSKAERIWSQGLRAVAGDVANAIVQILACAICSLPAGFIPPVLARKSRRRKAVSFPSDCSYRHLDYHWTTPWN